MYKNFVPLVLCIAAVCALLIFLRANDLDESDNIQPVSKAIDSDSSKESIDNILTSVESSNRDANISSREQFVAEKIDPPLLGSTPLENVKFSVPLNEIKQGCFRQDCIPSVDDPQFVSIDDANDILPEDTIGIALSYKGVDRFYPFNMLATREIVNDVVAGDPLLITYCPLCGTGIVFDRNVNGNVYEFGVSGMLWQSNLLMYNRATDLEDRNLWSQVLGEAVLGNDTGIKLTNVPSDIMRYHDWVGRNPSGSVLNTGNLRDPYDGDYYGVAKHFGPNFDEENSPLDPSTYIYGVEVQGLHKAYPADILPIGETADTIGDTDLVIVKSSEGTVNITDREGNDIPDIEGFWFSWIAAHPETALWQK